MAGLGWQQGKIAALLAGGIMLGSPAGAASLAEGHEQLLRAICLNDWEGAIALTAPLIAAEAVTPDYRQSMVELRDIFEVYRVTGAVIPDINNCEQVLRRYVTVNQVPIEPLDWAAAIDSVLNDGLGPPPPITQAVRQQEAAAVADLDRFEAYDIPALSPALVVSLHTGSGVSGGTVTTGQEIYTFFAGLGDPITLDIDVDRVLPGSLYTDDDTQIFLFDANGKLLAENDDQIPGEERQSRLESFVLPRTGRYYVAVTTYNNDPILNERGYIVGWAQTGGSAVEYTLTVSGATPTEELILTNYGPETLAPE
ncbi:MAG: DVUA0089 family protein [Leptolyngbyaceae cyanobacterium]